MPRKASCPTASSSTRPPERPPQVRTELPHVAQREGQQDRGIGLSIGFRPAPSRRVVRNPRWRRPQRTMALMPRRRMGPPLRSFAADAQDCIMVTVHQDQPNTRLWRVDPHTKGELSLGAHNPIARSVQRPSPPDAWGQTAPACGQTSPRCQAGKEGRQYASEAKLDKNSP